MSCILYSQFVTATYLRRKITITHTGLVSDRGELVKLVSWPTISTTEVALRSYLSVSPYARSSMSFSSSVIASNWSYMCFSKMRWQVEQARVPSHAPKPSMSRLFSITTSSRESPTFPLVVNISPSRFKKWTVILSSELEKEAVLYYQ